MNIGDGMGWDDPIHTSKSKMMMITWDDDDPTMMHGARVRWDMMNE